jgi:PIN domain nuclease of toxin-antitoxin system
MAALIHLDTHVVVWLFAGDPARFSETALQAIEDHDLHISPMVMVELQYLYEVGKTGEVGKRVFERLESEIGLRFCGLPFSSVATRALEQTWTRDPFDRLIVSQAMLAGVPLLTRDRTIQQHYRKAFW